MPFFPRTGARSRPDSYPPNTFWVLESPNIAVDSGGERIDEPTNERAGTPSAEVRGWIATAGKLGKPRLTGASARLRTSDRPDVRAIYGLPATGFEADVDPGGARGPVSVSFTVDGAPQTIVVPTRFVDGDVPEVRARKLQRVRPHLRCVECRSALVDDTGSLECEECHATYEQLATGGINFLPDHLRSRFDIVPTENVSSNVYDGIMMNLINSHLDGIILDCGAGSQARYYPNVVNLEVVAYESTDVVAVGERLPFDDHTFDAVASFAVLEHVKDPFACAAEIQRVLKPGGTFYGQVPFLQPVHAYPNHFFNMTLQGFSSLFEGMYPVAAGVIPFGQPVFALSWMLNTYSAGLPPSVRESFEAMTVRELMEPPERSLGCAHVVDLDDAARSTLACANFIVARSPDP